MPAPRLLDKKRVNAELATERKQQIEQGKQLVASIEALREARAEEEEKLERFRKETVRAVQIEIDALIRQRDALRKELSINS